MVSMAISLPLRISWPFPIGMGMKLTLRQGMPSPVPRGYLIIIGPCTALLAAVYSRLRSSSSLSGDAMIRLGIGRNAAMSNTPWCQSGPVQAEYDFQLLEGDIVYDAVVCPLHEGRVDVAERQVSRGGQSCRECDGMLFGNAYVKCPFGNFLHHDTHTAAGGHRRCNGYNLPVGSGQFQKGFSEYVLVSGGSA